MAELLDQVRRLFGAHIEPLAGGHSGQTFRVGTPDGGSVVLRMFVGDPTRGAVTVGLYRLVNGLLPVPSVLDAQLEAGHPAKPVLVVETMLPGERLDVVLADVDDATSAKLGAAVGELAVRLSGMPFTRAGQFGGLDLHLRPWRDGGGPTSAAERFLAAQAGRQVDPTEAIDGDGLLAAADEAEDLLAEVGRVCLVHGDLNPKNVLVDVDRAVVTGLVDWEYGHAGTPVTDLGNLTRFGDHPAFEEAVVRHVLDHAPSLPPEPLRAARAVDLISLLDLAERHVTGSTSDITRRALELVGEAAIRGSV